MNVGEYVWDTPNEIRTLCKLSCKFHDGPKFFTAGKTPLATAILLPDGETLQIIIRYNRIKDLKPLTT